MGLLRSASENAPSDHQVTADRRPADVPRVRGERQHEEQPAQHVLPFRHPGDRLHVQRMDRKQRRHKGAGPEFSRHLEQEEEQQDGRGGVQRNAGQVVSAGMAKTVDLAIRHVRDPGERVPIGGMTAGEGPREPVGRQTAGDVRVLDDVLIVVIVDERVTRGLAKHARDQNEQNAADGNDSVRPRFDPP